MSEDRFVRITRKLMHALRDESDETIDCITETLRRVVETLKERDVAYPSYLGDPDQVEEFFNDLEGRLIRDNLMVDFSKHLKRNRPAESDESFTGEQGSNMSLEESIAKLITTIEANTKALSGAKPAATTAAATTTTKPTVTKPTVAKHTAAETQALLGEVQEKFGKPAAIALRNEFGKVDKMKDLTNQADIDALFEGCKAKLAEVVAEEDETGGDGL